MAQNFENMSELDRMKADAIKRARQMHLRAANLPPSLGEQNNSERENQPKARPQNAGISRNGLLEMIRVMGFENDQLILIALILMLSGEKDNFPLILALLYIAL